MNAVVEKADAIARAKDASCGAWVWLGNCLERPGPRRVTVTERGGMRRQGQGSHAMGPTQRATLDLASADFRQAGLPGGR